MHDKVLALLGLAQRARFIASGNFQVEEAVAKRKAKLVLIAEDAAANTRDGLEKITYHYGIPAITYGTKETLGHSIGKEDRSCVAVLDEGFAAKIRDLTVTQ